MMPPKPLDSRVARAKYPGSGLTDTPAEAWEALRRDFFSCDEPMTDVVHRHDIRYSAAITRANRERWHERRDAQTAAAAPVVDLAAYRRRRTA